MKKTSSYFQYSQLDRIQSELSFHKEENVTRIIIDKRTTKATFIAIRKPKRWSGVKVEPVG